MFKYAERWVKLLTPFLAVAAFAWGVWKHFDEKTAERMRLQNEQVKEQSQRRIEATKPFLEQQLAFYVEATRSASVLATADDPAVLAVARARFLQLFWGELALVEDGDVEPAMGAFKGGLDRGASPDELEQLSLRLAHACRDSLSRSWNTPAWKSHYAAQAAGN